MKYRVVLFALFTPFSVYFYKHGWFQAHWHLLHSEELNLKYALDEELTDLYVANDNDNVVIFVVENVIEIKITTNFEYLIDHNGINLLCYLWLWDPAKLGKTTLNQYIYQLRSWVAE